MSNPNPSTKSVVSVVSASLPGIESRHLLSEAVLTLKIKHFDPSDEILKSRILDCINDILMERMLSFDELLIFGYSRENTFDRIPTDIMKLLFEFYGTEMDWDTESESDQDNSQILPMPI